jgi:hypothetical protein
MRKRIEPNMPEMRALSPDEMAQVSGAMINLDKHHSPTHFPGRLGPDEFERGTIAGAGL